MKRKIDQSVIVLLIAILFFGFIFFFLNNEPKSEVLISERMSTFIDAIDRIHINRNKKLIIFDLDDTIYTSSSILGTPTWYYNVANFLRQKGAAESEAFAVVDDIDRVIQENVNVVAVEQTTLSAIKNWQNSGVVVVAITSRPASFQTITDHHLKHIGLRFDSPVFKCVEEEWKNTSSKFKNGVMYTGAQQSKDEMFQEFYVLATECGLHVELLGHADDQHRYISKIAKFAKKKGINYIGIIYDGALARTEFNIFEANQQLKELELKLNRRIIPEQYRHIFTNAN